MTKRQRRHGLRTTALETSRARHRVSEMVGAKKTAAHRVRNLIDTSESQCRKFKLECPWATNATWQMRHCKSACRKETSKARR